MINKKILYIGGFELPDKNAAAHRVISNSKAIRELGGEVILAGVNKEISEPTTFDCFKYISGFKTYELNYPRNIREWISYLTSSGFYKNIILENDVNAIICYNLPSIVLKKLFIFCRKNNIKIYADVTEWYSSKGRSIPNKILKGFDTSYRMKILHKKLDGLIVISNFLKEYYSDFLQNVILIPALVDLNDSKWRNNFKKSHTQLTLVYAGNPSMKKENLGLMITSLQSVKRKVVLEIIGITKEEFYKMFPNFNREISLNNINFHGRLSHADSLDFIKKANYSYFIRDEDIVSLAGFPTKLVESISCGTPVLTNTTSNISDFIFSNINGVLINSSNPLEIAHIIDKLDYNMNVNIDTFDYRKFIKDDKLYQFFLI